LTPFAWTEPDGPNLFAVASKPLAWIGHPRPFLKPQRHMRFCLLERAEKGAAREAGRPHLRAFVASGVSVTIIARNSFELGLLRLRRLAEPFFDRSTHH
jgi:hypothetical protein